MANQIFWDDVTEGLEIGPVVRHPTTQQLVKYAGALRRLLPDSLR